MATLFSEHRGTFSKTKLYRKRNVEDNNEEDLEIVEEEGNLESVTRSSWALNLLLIFRRIFLPNGFPASVSSDYVEYQIYDTIQAFSSSITGALATEAVFKSVGVGSNEASPLAAALTWLIKSGSGMIGSIVFAWAKGTALDYDNKKWRLFADVLNDCATFLDLITPLFPSGVVVIFVLCVSSVARALVGVAGGATRAAITQHQARRNNAADVSAKDGSQETLVNLISLIVSLFLLPAVSGKHVLVWTLFFAFTFLHVFANYRALRALNLESFNRSRLLIALKEFLIHHKIPTVREVNKQECLIVGFGVKDTDVCGFRIRLGVSLQSAIPQHSASKIQGAILESNGKPFLIIPSIEQKTMSVILSEHILPEAVNEAFIRSVLLAQRFSFLSITEKLEPVSSDITKEWESFCHYSAASGFNMSVSLLEAGDWRGKWKHA